MIMTVTELRQFIETDATDKVLETMLQSIELAVRAYTNNNFQVRAYRTVAASSSIRNSLAFEGDIPFVVGDTLQITESDFMSDSLVTVASVSTGEVTVEEDLYDEEAVVITKVKYPQDVKLGVVNLLKWELEKREKVGIASESISRHSVTYVDQTGANTVMGYPVALMGFLKSYKKARFGRGIRV